MSQSCNPLEMCRNAITSAWASVRHLWTYLNPVLQFFLTNVWNFRSINLFHPHLADQSFIDRPASPKKADWLFCKKETRVKPLNLSNVSPTPRPEKKNLTKKAWNHNLTQFGTKTWDWGRQLCWKRGGSVHTCFVHCFSWWQLLSWFSFPQIHLSKEAQRRQRGRYEGEES